MISVTTADTDELREIHDICLEFIEMKAKLRSLGVTYQDDDDISKLISAIRSEIGMRVLSNDKTE